MRKNRFSVVISAILFMTVSLSACSSLAVVPTDATAGASAPAVTASAAPSPTAAPTEEPTASPTTLPTESPTPEATAAPTPEPTAETTPAPTADPDAPPALGLYERRARKLNTEFTGPWTKGRDIAVFFALPTDKASVEKGAAKSLVEKYWNEYRKEGYRIGYVVNFTLESGKTFHLNIRRPKDAPPHDPTKEFIQYVEIYMYDNAKKDPDGDYGTWHLQEKFMTPEVLITSIKLTAGQKISEVTSIDLTAYVYKNDSDSDFDPDTGEYTGNLSTHIPINKK